MKDIINFIHSKPVRSKWVVQKYLEKPMLYGTRKFDIWVWSIWMPDGWVYFYKEGYLWTSSEEFTLDIRDN